MEGYQRRHLRGLAHDLKPVVLVGQQGISEGVVQAVDEALEQHELIKVRLHEPEDKKSMAQDLALRSGAELCGLVGHTAILYREREDEPTIVLPQR